MATPAFRILSLCSGVGGLELGIRIARPESRCVCHVERKPYAVRVLRERMRDGSLDDAPIWDDVLTFDPAPWRGRVDCVAAGYPCQTFSSAARGNHVAPDLSGEVLRVVAGCRPAVVFVENVYHARRSLARLREDFARLGYRSPPLLDCRASDVGAPHVRRRLFLLGHADGHREPGLPVDAEVARVPPPRVSPWEDRPDPLRMVDGTAHRVDGDRGSRRDRLDVCGNGVVPLVAALAWRTGVALLEGGDGRVMGPAGVQNGGR